MHIKNYALAVACAAASIAHLAPQVLAQNYTEVGDAGATLGTAQATGLTQTANGTPPQNIFGTISGTNDADFYSLTLNAPALFIATTNNTLTNTSGLDTQLFLFTSSGAPVYANDDATGFSLTSTLPAGRTFTASLLAGTYFIAISLSGNDPINTSNQLMFLAANASTDVRGPTPNLNPNSVSGFNSANTFAQTGTYQITIVPEPSTWTLALVGAGVLGATVLRRRQKLA